jgi:hypothetical protein
VGDRVHRLGTEIVGSSFEGTDKSGVTLEERPHLVGAAAVAPAKPILAVRRRDSAQERQPVGR